MKDLDFDELDRAVNSLINKNDALKVTTEVKKAEVPVVNPTPVAVPVSKPTPISVAPTPKPAPSPTVVVNSRPAAVNVTKAPTKPSISPMIPPISANAVKRPNSGNFMDMMGASSNMRAPQTVQKPAMTPQKPPLNNLQTRQRPNIPTPFTRPFTSQPPAASVYKPPVIPMANLGRPTVGMNGEQITPFLTDTKVEKRPLNAFSTELTENAASEAPKLPPDPINEQVNQEAKLGEAINQLENKAFPTDTHSMFAGANLGINNKDASTLLPPELQNELLSIESDMTPIKEEDMKSEAVAASAPTPIVQSTPVSQSTPAVSAPVAQPVAPVATSIPQQYKEQPSTSDQTNGAIYDAAYHKALLHPVKRKNGWMWVVWTIALLVVGVLSGVGVYYYVLPNFF